MKLLRVAALIAMGLTASCRDCPEGLVPVSADVTREGEVNACGVFPGAGCIIVSARYRRDVQCAREPEPAPLPQPNPSTFSPFQMVGYEWTELTAAPIIGLASIDIAGSTLPFGSVGEVTINAFGADQTVTGSIDTTWQKSGNDLVLSDTAAVSSWMGELAHACDFELAFSNGAPVGNGRYKVSMGAQYGAVEFDRMQVAFRVSGDSILPPHVQ